MSIVGAIHVTRPGLLTTVQDLGRWGHQASGVPVAGPMDTFSHRLANILVGNAPDAAGLEVTLIGPDLLFDAASVVAVCGAEFEITCDQAPVPPNTPVWVPPGGRLQFGRRLAGARAYVAVYGGLQTPVLLGSRSTHLVSRMGGVEGRALVGGDRLPIHAATARAASRRAKGITLPTGGRALLRVLPGPQHDWFGPAAHRAMTADAFRLSPRSNRMGYRLEGPPLVRLEAAEPISEPLAFGAIQVPTAGEPILLMADRQTAGGYPKIGYVASADLPVAAQLAPGDMIQFSWCTRQEAAAALIARERQLLRVE